MTHLHEFERTISQLIECAICKDDYVEPVLLPCNHTFCLNCVKRWQQEKNTGEDMGCPLCRKEFRCTDDVLRNLSINARADSLVKMKTILSFIKEQKRSATDVRKGICSVHTMQKIEYYCEECDQLACIKCIKKSHRYHKRIDVKVAEELFSSKLTDDLNKVGIALSVCLKNSDVLQRRKEALRETATTVQTEVKRRADELIRQINDQQDLLLQQIADTENEKLMHLRSTTEEIEQQTAVINGFIESALEINQHQLGSQFTLIAEFTDWHKISDLVAIIPADTQAYLDCYDTFTFSPSNFMRYIPRDHKLFIGTVNCDSTVKFDNDPAPTWNEIKDELERTTLKHAKELKDANARVECAIANARKEMKLAEEKVKRANIQEAQSAKQLRDTERKVDDLEKRLNISETDLKRHREKSRTQNAEQNCHMQLLQQERAQLASDLRISEINLSALKATESENELKYQLKLKELQGIVSERDDQLKCLQAKVEEDANKSEEMDSQRQVLELEKMQILSELKTSESRAKELEETEIKCKHEYQLTLAELECKSGEWENQLRSARAKIKVLEEQIEKSKDSETDLLQKLGEANAALDEIKAQMEGEYQKRSSEKEDISLDLQQLLTDANLKTKALEKRLSAAENDFKRQLANSKARNVELNSSVQSLLKRRTKLQEKFESSEKTVTKLDETLNRNQLKYLEELDRMKSQLSSYETKLKQAQEDYENVNIRLRETTARDAQLCKQLKWAQADAEEVRRECAGAKQQSETDMTRVTAPMRQKIQKEVEQRFSVSMNDLKRQLAESKATTDDVSDQLRSLQTDRAMLMQRLNDYERAAAEQMKCVQQKHDDELNDCKRRLSSCQNNLRLAEDKAKQSTTSQTTLTRELKEKGQKIDDLEKRLHASNSDIKQLRATVRTRNIEIHSRLQLLAQEKSDLQTQLKASETAVAELIENDNANQRKYNQEIDRLETELANLDKQAEQIIASKLESAASEERKVAEREDIRKKKLKQQKAAVKELREEKIGLLEEMEQAKSTIRKLELVVAGYEKAANEKTFETYTPTTAAIADKIVSMKAARTIHCWTVLNGELFALINRSTDIDVYDTATHILRRHLTVPGIVWYRVWTGTDADMAACKTNRYVYIADRHTGIVHRIDARQQQQSPTETIGSICSSIAYWWAGDGRLRSVSVTPHTNVLVLLDEPPKMKEFSSSGVLIRNVNLGHQMSGPTHAIQLPNERFLVCHAASKNNDERRVCLVDERGTVMTSYGPRRHDRLSTPRRVAVDDAGFVFVADYDGGRVILLNPQLEYVEDVGRGDFCGPWNMQWDSADGHGRLYVEDWSRMAGCVLVVDVNTS